MHSIKTGLDHSQLLPLKINLSMLHNHIFMKYATHQNCINTFITNQLLQIPCLIPLKSTHPNCHHELFAQEVRQTIQLHNEKMIKMFNTLTPIHISHQRNHLCINDITQTFPLDGHNKQMRIDIKQKITPNKIKFMMCKNIN